jgi:hydrogenase nickel incorporation protein HypB
MFQAAEIMLLNKIDLLPHLDFDMSLAIANALKVNPNIIILRVSARSGEGMNDWYDWLRRERFSMNDAAVL